MVLAALKRSGVDAHAFDPRDESLDALKSQRFDRAFIALHGRLGEDGTVQGALEYLGVPYTGSGVMASALAMDKWRTKLLWQAAGLPTPRYEVITARTDTADLAKRIGLPLMVKPAREGSTIGMSKVTSVEKLAPAYELATRYDEIVIAEQIHRGAGAHRRHPRRRSAAAYPSRGAARQLRLPGQVLRRTTRSTSAPPDCPPTQERALQRAGARGIPAARLQRLGARGPDARPAGQLLAARSEHHSRHDRPQPGADGGAGAGHFVRGPGVRILESAHVG